MTPDERGDEKIARLETQLAQAQARELTLLERFEQWATGFSKEVGTMEAAPTRYTQRGDHE